MLEVINLNKKYGENVVINNLNLKVNRGEIYGLIGNNGAGKTTLINIISGLLDCDSGLVLINDRKVSQKAKYLLGVAPQENIIYEYLTCWQNLAFFGALYGLKGRYLTASIRRCLQIVSLWEVRDKLARFLSGGMQKRLNIAIALIHNPLLLILDEPTTGLDVSSRYEIWQLILGLKQQGVTILLATHFLDEAEKLCDCVGILKGGKIVKQGSIPHLKSLIPAKELIHIQTDALAKQMGMPYRYYQGDLFLLMEREWDIREIITLFRGINIRGITKKDISLEHVYLEVMGEGN